MDVSRKILSDVAVYMKYAKFVPEFNRRETWDEIVYRNMSMHIEKFKNVEGMEDEIRNAYKFVYDKKILPSMRSLQFAGKPIDVNPTRLYNCAFLPIDDWRAFSEVIFLLLGGTGVGYSVQFHHIEKLPEIRKPIKHKRYLISDSIEGWADAVRALIKAYLVGGPKPIFDFRDIRPKGARLITSGGKAPGPEPLKECLFQIEKILDRKGDGDKLTPLEAHLILCHEADAVLAGGIRRAAMISLFSFDDDDMLTCKFGNWWETNPELARSNNSAVIVRNRIEKSEFINLWEKIKASRSGEPGFFFTNDIEWGLNPCFTGDTKVLVKDHDVVSDGEIVAVGQVYEIPIKMLVDMRDNEQPLPMAVSYNTETNEIEYKNIDDAALTRKNSTIIEVVLEDGTCIKCTPDHKFYTKNRGYVSANDLVEEDIIIKIE